MSISPITAAALSSIRAMRVDDAARDLAMRGAILTHEQADDIGEERLGWVRDRLGLNVSETTDGTELTPPVHFVGVDEDGARITAEDVL